MSGRSKLEYDRIIGIYKPREDSLDRQLQMMGIKQQELEAKLSELGNKQKSIQEKISLQEGRFKRISTLSKEIKQGIEKTDEQTQQWVDTTQRILSQSSEIEETLKIAGKALVRTSMPIDYDKVALDAKEMFQKQKVQHQAQSMIASFSSQSSPASSSSPSASAPIVTPQVKTSDKGASPSL